MVSHIPSQPDLIHYPDSDGQPMADNTLQFRWIVTLKENIDDLFAEDPNVFVAGDLLWYPVARQIEIRQAPDVMVVLGRPKGERGSYVQHREEDIPPQVVVEVLSPGNTRREMNRKLAFYDRYGVEEYYIYDPDRNQLKVWLRTVPGQSLTGGDRVQQWTSPRLGIRFEVVDPEMQVYGPDGRLFERLGEQRRRLEGIAEQERQRADQERQRAEQERQRAEQEQRRSEEERQRADEATQRADRLAQRMRELGMDPESL